MNNTVSTSDGPLGPARYVLFDLYHTLTSVEAAGAAPGVTAAGLGVTPEAWRTQLLQHSRDRLVGRERDPFRIIAGMARRLNSEITDEAVRTVVAGDAPAPILSAVMETTTESATLGLLFWSSSHSVTYTSVTPMT